MSDFYTIKLHKDDEIHDFTFEKSFKSKYIYKQLMKEIEQLFGGNLIPAWKNDDDVLIHISSDDDIDEAIRFHRHSEVNRHNFMNFKYSEMSVSIVAGKPGIEEDDDENDAYKKQEPIQEGIVEITSSVNPHHIQTDRELYELQQQYIQEQRVRVENNVANQRVPNRRRPYPFDYVPRHGMPPDVYYEYRVENGVYVPIRRHFRDQQMDVDDEVEDHLNRIIQQERQQNGGDQMPENNRVENNREFRMFANDRGENPFGMAFGNGFMNEYPVFDAQIGAQNYRPLPEQYFDRRRAERDARDRYNRMNEQIIERRRLFTDHQRQELLREFAVRRRPDFNERQQIANRLGLLERQVRLWFQTERYRDMQRERGFQRFALN